MTRPLMNMDEPPPPEDRWQIMWVAGALLGLGLLVGAVFDYVLALLGLLQ